MEQIDEQELRRLRIEATERNRRLMPNLTALMAEVRAHPQMQGVLKTMKLIYGIDQGTGMQVGTPGAVQVHALDLQPRRVK